MDAKIPVYPDLAGKVAVVTGSSQGIGATTCHLLAANGAKVVVNGRDPAALEETVTKIRRDGGEATGVAGDVADPAALERLRAETERTYGPTDVLGRSSGEAAHPPDPPPRSLRRNGKRPSAATSPSPSSPCGASCRGWSSAVGARS
jgi:NAD(P)-dependent dehydrogenase (short-subunit alcohol dehydrogenase family)